MNTQSTNEAQFKVTVQADRTMFGKRTGKFVAQIGEFVQYGLDKDHALECLKRALDRLYMFGNTRRYLVTPKGTVFALYHTWGGWAYDIVRESTNSPSSCMLNVDSEREAFERMQSHFQQMLQDEQSSMLNPEWKTAQYGIEFPLSAKVHAGPAPQAA